VRDADDGANATGFTDSPNLPEGRVVELPGRGTTFIRDLPATKVGAPTIILLHGWTVTSDLNFHLVYDLLANRTGARIIAMDQRGHGRGVRPRTLFKLDECADDVSALIDELKLQNVIVLGYSMGGAIAQWIAKRHPEKIVGAIFCATTCHFGPEQKTFGVWDIMMPAFATGLTIMPSSLRQAALSRVAMVRRSDNFPTWMREEAGRSDPAMVVQAGIVIGKFDARPWLPRLTMPTAVVKTMQDTTVPPRRQQVLIDGLPNVSVHECDADHRAAVSEPELFVSCVVDAVNSVLSRQNTSSK
jgi:3-oxoadipate enol-lactonase